MGLPGDAQYRDCPWCQTKNLALRQVSQTTAERSNGSARHWTWFTCPRCAGVISLESNAFNEGPPMELAMVPDTRNPSDVDHLPEDVAKYYSNALTVLGAGVPSSAAVELRRTLEAAASHHGITERTLVKSVQKLADKGLITKDFETVLGHIRKVGNQGAHATDVDLSEEDVRRALRFTTQVLRNLFEVPAELALLGVAPAADGTDVDGASAAET